MRIREIVARRAEMASWAGEGWELGEEGVVGVVGEVRWRLRIEVVVGVAPTAGMGLVDFVLLHSVWAVERGLRGYEGLLRRLTEHKRMRRRNSP